MFCTPRPRTWPPIPALFRSRARSRASSSRLTRSPATRWSGAPSPPQRPSCAVDLSIRRPSDPPRAYCGGGTWPISMTTGRHGQRGRAHPARALGSVGVRVAVGRARRPAAAPHIVTSDVISKSSAGAYALGIVAAQWHDVVGAAIALRADRQADIPKDAAALVADAVPWRGG